MSRRGGKGRGMTKKKAREYYASREAGFDLNLKTSTSRAPEYNGLLDRNLRHYFENRRLQSHLHKVGLIDRGGHVIDLAKHQGKLAIIDQEFKAAELEERRRLQEEAEMRKRVQAKRHETLERARFKSKMERVKEDRRIRADIVRVAKGEAGLDPSPSDLPSLRAGSRASTAGSGRGFGSTHGSGF